MKLQVNEVNGDRRTMAVDGAPGEGWGRVVIVIDKKDSVKFDFVAWKDGDKNSGILEIVTDSDKSMLLLTLQKGVNP